jgi:MFS family permease
LKKLNRGQKEAIGLLQIGTFLEYFDLMLYVHMAVLLNQLFFPKTDPHTAALLAAFAFCSTYVLRPFGALIFGYIGDTIGRKATVILTTMIMSISCMIMANLPTYEQIGIAAAWLITLCRVSQGLSSMGEIVGAQIYVTEITQPPAQYPAVAFVTAAAAVGATAALGIASLVTHAGLNWRLAFWIGAGIAVIGSVARTRLRETPEFLVAKEKKISQQKLATPRDDAPRDKISKRSFVAFFFTHSGWPLSFYLVFVYFNPTLSGSFGYSPEDIILHNFWLSLIFLGTFILWAVLSYRFHPLQIVKVRVALSAIYTLFVPFLASHCTSATQLFMVQAMLLLLSLSGTPTEPVMIKNFPVFHRFKVTSFIYALSRALMYICTAFGLVYLTEWFGHWGILLIAYPTIIGLLWSMSHFEQLETNQGRPVMPAALAA